MKDELIQLEAAFIEALRNANDAASCSDLKVQTFGKKGTLTLALRSIGDMPAAQRAVFGSKVNQLRQKLEALLEEQERKILRETEDRTIQNERIDVGLPGRKPASGALHPLTLVERKVTSAFRALGFSVETGPDIETDYYNFESLNFPPDHPARDMQDTFFVDGGLLLRTHTSPVQMRTMEKKKPPLRIIVPGRVYRHDSDVAHSPVFHQVEGLCVGPDITFAHLKGALEAFVHMMFGRETAARFRPSFFPFTEPSAELDMQCGTCKGKGCRTCKETGWLEILGCGMVDPNVFEFAGKAWKARGEENPYDPERISGFAFGMGIERTAMVLNGIDDIRLFYENDLRFLGQFGE